jgi:uncharacterized OsmC-like protein
MNAMKSIVFRRQAPLRAAYKDRPEEAVIYKRVRTGYAPGVNALHGTVIPGDGYGVAWPYGIDRAVGGMHDAPNPGDIICAALAACQDSTLRMVADLLGVSLEAMEVEVIGKVDVRGSLAVDPTASIGFQSMECNVRLRPAPGTPDQLVKKLLAMAERSCINLATLRSGVPVPVAFGVDESVPERSLIG